jgi:hypothetical protein
MIRQKTVFIIGAGASKPYGYPTGKELREKIISGYNRWKELLYPSWHQIGENFLETFRKSGNVSIDLFLSRNPEFRDVGKVAIVKTIADCEHHSKFGDKMEKSEEDWYSFIFQEMTKEIATAKDFGLFAENKITFIIFNYDRSFEYYLEECFLNSFQSVKKEEIYEVLRKIPIYHVYGQVAYLPWQKQNEGFRYNQITFNNEQSTKEIMIKLSKNIHVIGEERQGIDTSLKQAQIGEAEKVFFLGFGFAKENLEVLNLPNLLQPKQQIFGSGVGLLKEEIINLRSIITDGATFLRPNPARPHPQNVVIESGVSCTDILRKYLFLTDKKYLSHLFEEAKGYNA